MIVSESHHTPEMVLGWLGFYYVNCFIIKIVITARLFFWQETFWKLYGHVFISRTFRDGLE
jgi:hypothetical protein